MESALVDADCRPALCAGPTTTTPPARASITPRGFTWDVQTTGDMTTVKFAPGKPSLGLQPTLSVDLNYRVNGGPQTQVASMTSDGSGGWTWQTNTLKANDDVDFFFHSKVAKQTIVNPGPDIQPLLDTMWFHQRVGMPRDPEPQYPIVSKLAGRFRDRHPNEERFDHFVDTYFSGPTFDMTVVDNGDSIDVTIAPQASMQVQAVDFKNYEAMGSGEGGALPSPTPLCFTPPAIAALGVRATPMGASVWKGHLGNLSYGQLVDWELTFVRSRTYYTEWFQYYVGSGRLQPKVMHPWAHAAGDQSVTDVSTDEFGYAQHVPNLSPQELADFITGKVLFEADFQTHVGYNEPDVLGGQRVHEHVARVDPAARVHAGGVLHVPSPRRQGSARRRQGHGAHAAEALLVDGRQDGQPRSDVRRDPGHEERRQRRGRGDAFDHVADGAGRLPGRHRVRAAQAGHRDGRAA
jgi:hypothetical protein